MGKRGQDEYDRGGPRGDRTIKMPDDQDDDSLSQDGRSTSGRLIEEADELGRVLSVEYVDPDDQDIKELT